MRRRSRRLLTLLATVVATLALAAPAHAVDHLMEVNEVMLSSGGSEGAQFVELLDPQSEPFPSPEYRLVVYDTNGVKLAHQAISTTILAANVFPILIASDAANLPQRDAQLTIQLPTNLGQLCFTGDDDAERRISCVAWGCVATKVSSQVGQPTPDTLAPPDNQSAQRQANETLQIAAPTPRAANNAGTSNPPCTIPQVVTGAASGITSTGATLNGTVDPNGSATNFVFDLGTTTAYGVSTPAASAGSGGSPVPVSATIAGLSPGTTYHYRVRATNGFGSANGGDRTFTTAAAGGGGGGGGTGDTGDGTGGTGGTGDPGPITTVVVLAQRLATVLRRGLRITAQVNEAATILARVILSRRAAKSLGLPRVIARGSARLREAGSATFRARFTRKAKRRLRRARRVRATLNITATDTAGNKTTLKRPLTLKR